MWIVLFCPTSFEIRFAVFWIGIHYILIHQNIFHHNIQLWVVTWCTWSPSDIDECSQMNICDEHASCSNTQGSYSCACNPEYTGDGLTCKGLSLLIRALKIFNAGTGWTRCKYFWVNGYSCLAMKQITLVFSAFKSLGNVLRRTTREKER